MKLIKNKLMNIISLVHAPTDDNINELVNNDLISFTAEDRAIFIENQNLIYMGVHTKIKNSSRSCYECDFIIYTVDSMNCPGFYKGNQTHHCVLCFNQVFEIQNREN